MQPEREHFSGNTKLNIVTKSRLAILVTHHSDIDKPPQIVTNKVSFEGDCNRGGGSLSPIVFWGCKTKLAYDEVGYLSLVEQ